MNPQDPSGAQELNEWDAVIGPFYAEASLERWLGVDARGTLKERVERGEILALRLDSETIYPTFQFSTTGEPLPGLAQVLDVLSAGLHSRWDIALWLNNPIDGCPEVSTSKLLRDGRVDEVLRMAREDVGRWSR